MRYLPLVLFVFFVVLKPALAADSLEPLEKIRGQQDALASDLNAGKTEGLTPRQIGSIRKAQQEVFAVIDGRKSLDELSIDEKVRLENALERINAQAKGGTRVAREDQNVCWRERKSGSSMKVTRCGTEKERDQAREGARGFLERPRTCGRDCGAAP